MKLTLYIARDDDGQVFLYDKEPRYKNTRGQWQPQIGGNWAKLPINDCDTPAEITLEYWED